MSSGAEQPRAVEGRTKPPEAAERSGTPVEKPRYRGLQPVERQILRRSINDASYRGFAPSGGERELDLVCECLAPSCSKSLRMSTDEYERVRRFPTRFAVRPGHFERESERVVETTPGFIVIEKFGAKAGIELLLDLRRFSDVEPARPAP